MLSIYNFRIGNEKYVNDNNSYGITTLKKEHIKFYPNTKNVSKLTIEFIGKKGILNTYTDNNPKSSSIKLDLSKVTIPSALSSSKKESKGDEEGEE